MSIWRTAWMAILSMAIGGCSLLVGNYSSHQEEEHDAEEAADAASPPDEVAVDETGFGDEGSDGGVDAGQDQGSDEVSETDEGAVCAYSGRKVELLPVADTTIVMADETIRGSYDSLELGNADHRRILMRFDLSSYASCQIEWATLEITDWQHGSQLSCTESVKVCVLANLWDESQATWTKRTSDKLWDTAGGDMGTCPGSFDVKCETGLPITMTVSGGIKILVEQWLPDSNANQGLILKIANSGAVNNYNFRSKEYTPNLSIRPSLIIRFKQSSSRVVR